jgi:pimeloyl-ACP methyl ester carboxylesterase
VLVPGFTQTPSSWDAVRAGLDARVDVDVLDVAVQESFAATALALGEQGGRAIYCGYSMGGRLCLRLALDRPDLVAQLVLVSATPGIEHDGERERRIASDEALACAIETEGVEQFLHMWLGQPMFAGVPADAPGVADRAQLAPEYLAACLRVLGSGAMEPMWSRLGELAMPVTVVTGTRDAKFTAIGARLPGEHVALDCGHAIPLERPVELAAILNERCS